jgi:hypothetical protein
MTRTARRISEGMRFYPEKALNCPSNRLNLNFRNDCDVLAVNRIM